MNYIHNTDTFKVVTDGKYILMANKLDVLQQKHPSGQMISLNLHGLGNTGNGASGHPWLVTFPHTRTSYIFLQNEHVAPSYIAERLNFYDSSELEKVSNLVQKLVREV
jgi:hypothetical protein